MPATLSIVEADIRTALRNYALSLLATGVEVVRGRVNGVPMPTGAFAMLGSARIKPWRTNVDTVAGEIKTISIGAEMVFQCDVYGVGAADNAAMLAFAFRDDYPGQFMPAGADAMYATEPLQIPFVDSESNYEDRWTFDLTVGYNPTLTIDQQSALSVDIVLQEVDTYYPPGNAQ